MILTGVLHRSVKAKPTERKAKTKYASLSDHRQEGNNPIQAKTKKSRGTTSEPRTSRSGNKNQVQSVTKSERLQTVGTNVINEA